MSSRTKLNEDEVIVPIRGYSEKSIFYVYTHSKQDGSVFYVGKGHGDRAFVKKSRNKHWWNTVNKHKDYVITIVKDGMTEQEAFSFERELILEIGIDNLTNQTLGGISTTGFRHSEESKRKMSETKVERLLNDKDKLETITARLRKLHDKQRNDPLYKEKMAKAQKDRWLLLSDDEKLAHSIRVTEWMNDPIKKENALNKLRESAKDPVRRAKLSLWSKEYWANLDEEERLHRSKIHGDILKSKKVFDARIDKCGVKIIVNRVFLFKTIASLANSINVLDSSLNKALKNIKEDIGFTVFKGLFIEVFNEDIHRDVVEYNNTTLKTLDFDCMPRSKAVCTLDKVFLSMKEAAAFTGCDSEARADFITKNLKLGKSTLGYYWREATVDEVKLEILRRLNTLEQGKE